jgi:hypothetical protein
VEPWEGVADSLHSRRRKSCALADVKVCEPVFFLCLLHIAPPRVLAIHTAVCKGVHGTVCDVLAEVQAQGSQMRASIGKSNHTLICNKKLGTNRVEDVQCTLEAIKPVGRQTMTEEVTPLSKEQISYTTKLLTRQSGKEQRFQVVRLVGRAGQATS